ncbi:hypothetical protein KVV02_008811 [Mortierella alpina]|uniref:Uncharacterized protein n=1 Tax=Mortierella alpina TaxID=64518 RepID=A0A9P8CZX4_MORAP|nr:hypothetical protein KVV02_008811 [Mortierella alpina]
MKVDHTREYSNTFKHLRVSDDKLGHHEPTRHPAAPKDSEFPLKSVAPTFSLLQSKPAFTSVTPGPNGVSRQTMDFADLPARFRHPQLTEAEIEAVETGGATIIY